jgi:hypothetical protein
VSRIDDGILECVVYIYPDIPSAEAGIAAGGTGFLFGAVLSEQPLKAIEFVVTNRHVIDGGGRVVRINTRDGRLETREIEDPEWLRHPVGDDLAIARLLVSNTDKTNCLHYDLAITPSDIRAHNVGPGDDIFVVGRFINHEGKQQNHPTVRSGIIAQMPGEAISFPDGTEQDSFLVEARAISGFSGSPVFLNRGAGSRYHLRLLGINHCYLSTEEPVKLRTTKRPINDDWFVTNNTGMMGVIPAWRLTEMLGMPKVQEMIKEGKREVGK